MKESQIQSQILQWLMYRKIFAYRSNNGAVFDPKKGVFRRQGKYSINGVADITCCFKGRYVALEVKTEKGVLSVHQKAFKELVELAGGKYYVVRCIKDVEIIFN